MLAYNMYTIHNHLQLRYFFKAIKQTIYPIYVCISKGTKRRNALFLKNNDVCLTL